MTTPFATRLDALSEWRALLGGRLDELGRFLGSHELLDGPVEAQIAALRERLQHQKLLVAFVAEFSRGKSELINAIFFADTGRRVLPATPGRTTMCPVELGWDREDGPSLRLLPIETRLEGLALADLRHQPRAWRARALEIGRPDRLAEALQEVMRTRFVPKDQARALGFWDDERPDDNPPVDAAGRVEIPAWRHALINYPHPLLKQGLVVLDTPGLNAIGAEPELTLSLLPSAHATVFILGADAGVTRSDLGVWRDHLGTHERSRFVVLNKIDTLVDPLASAAEVDAQIERQCADTARTLGVEPERVFPISARQALAARVAGDAAGLTASRLPALEQALGSQLLPQRGQVLKQAASEAARQLEALIGRRLGDQRRQLAEQMLELRGLRGKSGARLRAMLQRIDAESLEFEQCTARLQALRQVHARQLKDALAEIATDRLRDELDTMERELTATLLKLGARKVVIALCGRLRAALAGVQRRSDEIRDLLGATFAKLNGEFGFSLALTQSPDLAGHVEELDEIEQSFVQYLGIGSSLRLSQAGFREQFRRLLLSKLRVVYESASHEIEVWNKATSSQVDSQLRERRRNFRHRRESIERVQAAASDLELRIVELEAQDERLQSQGRRLRALLDGLRETADAAPAAAPDLLLPTIDLDEAGAGAAPASVIVSAVAPARARARASRLA